MKKYLILLFYITLLGCTKKKEKIGYYQYNTEISRINIGEFDGLVFKYKSYYLKKNSTEFSVLASAQKLGFETKDDTIFAYGKLEIKRGLNKYSIFTKEFYSNGYDKFTQCDSVVREYEQTNSGKINFIRISYYYKGRMRRIVPQAGASKIKSRWHIQK